MFLISTIKLILDLLINYLSFAIDDIALSNVGSVTGCLQNTSSIDPFFGKLELNRDIYCSKGGGTPLPGFIDGVTCCYPMATDEFKFKMYLYLPGDDGQCKEVAFNDSDIGQQLRKYSKVVYIFHGYIEIPLAMPWITLTRKFWNGQKAAVIVADYSHGNQIDYYQSMANVRTAGMASGYSIVNWDIANNTLLIGQSLGGQLIGQAALFVNQHSKVKVAECHGLDPAGPMYVGAPKDAKLDRSDCDLVQIIHMTGPLSVPLSTAEARVIGSYGSDEKSGHCDFWVNCGYNQYESCTRSAVSGVTSVDIKAVPLGLVPQCGHSRVSVIYVNELYGKCNFTTNHCSDCGGNNLKCKSADDNIFDGFPPKSSCTPDMDANFVLFTADGDNQCKSYIKGNVLNPIGVV